MNKHKGHFAVVVLLMLCVVTADSWAQSIADVARKERARQKQIPSSKVYTNSGTVPTTASTSSTSNTPSVTQAPAPPAKSSGPTDNKGRDEKYWRSAFEKARQDVQRADDKVQLLDLKIKELNTQLLRGSDVYNRENRVSTEITTAQTDLTNARKEAEQARRKIADLEEELRRSGGLPGWSR